MTQLRYFVCSAQPSGMEVALKVPLPPQHTICVSVQRLTVKEGSFDRLKIPLQHGVPMRRAQDRIERSDARHYPWSCCLERHIVIGVDQSPLVIDEPMIAGRITVKIAVRTGRESR